MFKYSLTYRRLTRSTSHEFYVLLLLAISISINITSSTFIPRHFPVELFNHVPSVLVRMYDDSAFAMCLCSFTHLIDFRIRFKVPLNIRSASGWSFGGCVIQVHTFQKATNLKEP
jgi:hypothetical protein